MITNAQNAPIIIIKWFSKQLDAIIIAEKALILQIAQKDSIIIIMRQLP
jgi:hypothetical protein